MDGVELDVFHRRSEKSARAQYDTQSHRYSADAQIKSPARLRGAYQRLAHEIIDLDKRSMVMRYEFE